MMERRVVVTGVGMISPLGNNVQDSWGNMLESKSGAARVTQFDPTGYPSTIAAEVKNFNPENYVQAKAVKRYDRFSLFAIAASREAWLDCGLTTEMVDPTKIGTIIGVGIGGLRYLEDNHTELIEGGPRKLSPFLIPAMISNLAPGNVAIDLGFKGVNYTITSACTSGTHAIGELR
jgi:3-oxoacyl-[acyl-carrier-protein] synthase II